MVRGLKRRAEQPRLETVAVADDKVGGGEAGVVDDPLDALVRRAQRGCLSLFLVVVVAEEPPVPESSKAVESVASEAASSSTRGSG